MCIAVPLVLADGAAPVQADGTDNAPTEVARPIPAEMAGAPVPPILVEASVPVPEPRPTDLATPNSFAAVLTARAAVALLPVVKSLDSMLIGVVAICSGVLSSFSIDIADVEDDDDDEPVQQTDSELWPFHSSLTSQQKHDFVSFCHCGPSVNQLLPTAARALHIADGRGSRCRVEGVARRWARRLHERRLLPDPP